MRKNPNTHGDKCIMKLIKLYMSTQIYIHTHTHTRIHFATPLITNIFHMTMHKYYGGGIKILRDTVKYMCFVYKTYL